MTPFTVALLAGGMGSRMGRDKAMLPWVDTTLWESQCVLLESLEPCERFLLRGDQPPLARPGWVALPDASPESGPLAGIAAALARTSASLLLVVAVDLPDLNREFLLRLLSACSTQHGAIPVRDGYYEPTCAVYPASAAKNARERLLRGQLKLQDFAAELEALGLVPPLEVTEAEAPLLRNWNRAI